MSALAVLATLLLILSLALAADLARTRRLLAEANDTKVALEMRPASEAPVPWEGGSK